MGSYQKEVSGYFSPSGMFFIVGLAHLLNSLQAGILLSQLLYWHDRTSDPSGWIYKSIQDFHRETGLNRSGQETAIRKLKALNIIDVRLFGLPATRHFRVKTEQLDILLSTLPEPNNQVLRNSTNKIVGNQQTINTDSTQENTTDSTFDVNAFVEYASTIFSPP